MTEKNSLNRLRLPFIFLLYLFLASICFYRAVFQGRLIASGNALLYFYPLKLYYATSFWHHGFHWWLPYEFLGLPFLGTLQTGILYPLNWFYFFLPVKDIAYGFNWSLIVHYALAGFFTYLYVRLLGLRDIPAFLAGMVFGLSGFMMAHKETINMQNTGVWLPLLLYFYEKIRRDLKFRDALWAGIAAGVQQLAGHTQICVYSTFVLGLFTLFFIFYQEKGKRLRFLILCALPVVLGVLIALPQILATTQLLFHSYHFVLSRGVFSLKGFPPQFISMLIFPFVFGGGYGGHFSGALSFFLLEYSGFTGVLPLVLAIWIFLRKYKDNIQIRFWGVVAYFSLFLVFGTYNPLTRFLFYNPSFNLFTVPSTNWFEFDFATAILFGFGIQNLFENHLEKKKEFIQVAAVMILVWISGISVLELNLFFPSFFPLKFSLWSISLFIPTLFACLYLLVLSLLYYFPGLRFFVLLLLGGVVFIEAFSFSAFSNRSGIRISVLNENFKSPIFRFLKTDAGSNRYAAVLLHTFPDFSSWPLYNVSDRINLLNGYDPLVSARFCRLTGVDYIPINNQWPVLLKNNLLLSLLDVKYLLVPKILGPFISEIKFNSAFHQAKFKVLKTHWNLYSAFYSKSRKIYLLRSPGPSRVSLMGVGEKNHPGNMYLFSLQIKAPQAPSSKLVIDLFRGRKSHPQYQMIRWIYPKEISRHFKHFYIFYDSMNISRAPRMYIRIYTFSRIPVFIKNPKIIFFKKYAPELLRGKFKSERQFLLYRKVFKEGEYSIYENLNALPRIFSIKNLTVARNLNQFKKKILLLRFNTLQTASVSLKVYSRIGRSQFSQGKVVLVKYGTDRIIARTNFRKMGFVVLSDQYYPGWEAFISGKKVPIYRTDELLRGVMVPPGSHLLEFRYHNPSMINLSFWVSAFVCVFCFAGIGIRLP